MNLISMFVLFGRKKFRNFTKSWFVALVICSRENQIFCRKNMLMPQFLAQSQPCLGLGMTATARVMDDTVGQYWRWFCVNIEAKL